MIYKMEKKMNYKWSLYLISVFCIAETVNAGEAYFFTEYDEEDATDEIQAALDQAVYLPSVDRVILRNYGNSWFSGPSHISSDTEFILESGVALVAKRGAFPHETDSFINVDQQRDVVIKGLGQGPQSLC